MFEGYLKAIRHESDEDVRFDTRVFLVMIGRMDKSLLSSLKACSISVNWM